MGLFFVTRTPLIDYFSFSKINLSMKKTFHPLKTGEIFKKPFRNYTSKLVLLQP